MVTFIAKTGLARNDGQESSMEIFQFISTLEKGKEHTSSAM